MVFKSQNPRARARRRQEYVRRMAGDEWKASRRRWIRLAGGKCQYDGGCTETEHTVGLHIHHLTYDNWPKERDEDVQVLCPDHHAVAELAKLRCAWCYRQIFTDEEDLLQQWRAAWRQRPELKWHEMLSLARKSAQTMCQKCEDATKRH